MNSLKVHSLLQRLPIGLHGLGVLYQRIGSTAQFELSAFSQGLGVNLVEQLLFDLFYTFPAEKVVVLRIARHRFGLALGF